MFLCPFKELQTENIWVEDVNRNCDKEDCALWIEDKDRNFRGGSCVFRRISDSLVKLESENGGEFNE